MSPRSQAVDQSNSLINLYLELIREAYVVKAGDLRNGVNERVLVFFGLLNKPVFDLAGTCELQLWSTLVPATLNESVFVHRHFMIRFQSDQSLTWGGDGEEKSKEDKKKKSVCLGLLR